MSKILAIDLGTTYFKFSLFDRAGRLCATHRIPVPVQRESPDRWELPASAFTDAIANGIRSVEERCEGGLSDVEAVGYATQANSFLLLDRDDVPQTPILLWPDLRAASFERELKSRCEVPEFRATTGIPELDSQFMPAKLLWLQKHQSEVWRRSARVCAISDYLTFLLTGQYIAEAGAAGLTGVLDIHACRWWPEMVKFLGLERMELSQVVRAGTDLGAILPAAADRYGLPRTCRFVVGCLDQYAGAIGVGNVQPGMISETTGTALAAVMLADQFDAQLPAKVFQGPGFCRQTYWRMAFSNVSANYLHWYREQLPDSPDYEELTSLASQVALGAEGLRLNTDVGPTMVSDVFHGMTGVHTRGHAVRCILEAVAYTLRDKIASLSDGPMPQDVRCAGGGARSELWLQIKADILGVNMTATECAEPTSLGAAVLAEVSLRHTGDVRSVIRKWVQLKPSHCPDANNHRRYQDANDYY
jgi:xylulokinase